MYEYLSVNIPGINSEYHTKVLNEYGQSGWEPFLTTPYDNQSTFYVLVYFRRPRKSS